MTVTLTIADDLASRLRPYEDRLPEILELGMRELRARGDSGYGGVTSVLETLAALPDPAEVLTLRPAPPLQERLDHLLEKSRAEGLSPDDQREWDLYLFVEHLVRLAKANATRKLKASNP